LGKKLYVGHLGDNMGKNDLEQMFAAHGAVTSAQVITDRDSGRSKGFGFVEMSSNREAQAAMAALNGKSIDGRSLIVNESRPQEGRGGGGFGGGRGGGGGFGRGRNRF
jgi:cold-inducible RNA-binding protein